MTKHQIYNPLRYIAMAGNLIYILWITYNGIDEGFRGTPVQIVSYIGLVTLLAVNIFLLYRKK